MSTDRINIALEMIDGQLKKDMLVSTKDFLLRLKECLTMEAQPEEEVTIPVTGERIIISCDASIKVNPGGPASVGVVIQNPKQKDLLQFAKATKATTNNQAEYDAVYTGLVSFVNLNNNPGMQIVVRSDSQLVIRQLKKEIQCQDKQLVKRRDLILELVDQLPVPVIFEWRPRNSTTELELANHLAQDLLGVPRH